jgi:hypothetical protein
MVPAISVEGFLCLPKIENLYYVGFRTCTIA